MVNIVPGSEVMTQCSSLSDARLCCVTPNASSTLLIDNVSSLRPSNPMQVKFVRSSDRIRISFFLQYFL